MSNSLWPHALQHTRLHCTSISPKVALFHVYWVNDAIYPPHPLLLPSSFAFNLSQHQGFSKESAVLIRWPKYWSFSFSISPSSEYSWLISIRTGWFVLLAVQGTLKGFLQHHSWKVSILQHSALCMYGPTLTPHMTIGKTIALMIQTFVDKVMCLLFNMPS